MIGPFGVEHGDISKMQTGNVLRVLGKNPGLLRTPGAQGDYAREALKRAGKSVGGKRRGFGYGNLPGGAPRSKPGGPTNWSRPAKSVRQGYGAL